MKDFFYAIQDLFVNVLFAPMDALRALELESWFAASIVSWIFILIGASAFVYWMLQLKKENDADNARKNTSAHV